jgi:hypothetical protein
MAGVNANFITVTKVKYSYRAIPGCTRQNLTFSINGQGIDTTPTRKAALRKDQAFKLYILKPVIFNSEQHSSGGKIPCFQGIVV